MIVQLVREDSFVQCLGQVATILDRQKHDLAANHRETVRAADGHELSLADVDDALQKVRGLLADPTLPAKHFGSRDAAWMPRDPLASVLQSSLEESYVQAGAVEKASRRRLAGGDVGITDLSLQPEWMPDARAYLTGPMEPGDPRWVFGFLAAKALQQFQKKRQFPMVAPKTAKLGDRARVVLVGDWGSGVPRAVEIGERMREQLLSADAAGRDLHMIHLGDVYYSGFKSEYENRFLPYWPVRKNEAGQIGSWCLNGNHDMFSGGHAYFDFLLREDRFARHQGGASYFALENDHWQILGLDTAYDPPDLRGDKGDLCNPQARWAAEKRASANGKKTMLLSHHQLFSPYEGGSPRLAEKLAPLLADPEGIAAWFWAHEHRCVLYENNDQHPVKNARLIGHGGVPVYATFEAKRAGVAWEFQDYFSDDSEDFMRFGFAVLDFDFDKIHVRYIDETGQVNHEEDIA